MKENRIYRMVLFDMDGTILDTLDDLADSVNHALCECGMPLRTKDEIRMFLGDGMVKLIERAAPESSSAEERAKLFASFKSYYDEHCMDSTGPYEGIPQALARLKDDGYMLACVSNKADDDVRLLADRFFPGLFDDCTGAREGLRTKPAPDLCDAVLKRCGAERSQAVYVGDTEVDILTAANAGMDCIVCGWGFREEAFLLERGAGRVIRDPMDIVRAVEEASFAAR